MSFAAHPRRETLAPAGVVVTSARPLFTWPAPPGARSVVEIFAGETEVMRSAELGTDRWRTTRDLPRGVTYTWTVRVEHDGSAQVLPAAPSPVARFHVLDGRTLDALNPPSVAMERITFSSVYCTHVPESKTRHVRI
jgi:hypothetical protein